MEIRNLNHKDSDQLVKFINETNGFTGTSKEISLSLFDQWMDMPSVTPEQDYFVAYSDNKIVGALQMVRESIISRAVAIHTISNSDLKKEILDQMTNISINYAQNHCLSVLHSQASSNDKVTKTHFINLGFDQVKTYLALQWQGNPLAKLKLPNNYRIRSFVLDKDEEILTNLQNTAFKEHWGFCPNSVDEIRRRVQMERSNPEGIIFIENESSIAGYNWTLISENTKNKVGWISMTGIHPDFRRKKLGRAVVLAGMHSLVQRGANTIELEVDFQNTPAKDLYESLGFRPVSSSYWYEKHL